MGNASDLQQHTTQYLHTHIPITQVMGVRVELYDAHPGGGSLTLTAPLAPNHNHLGTAFGGSLSALCTLAGYALLWLELGDSTAHVVVKESAISYRHPVRGDADGLIRVTGLRPDAPTMEAFHSTFLVRKKARVEINCRVVESGQTCVDFRGTFVAIRP